MSRKQWGHGFHTGKRQVISDLLKDIDATICDDILAPIYLRQVGGKVCVYTCPICRAENQYFKPSQNIGGCFECGSIIKNLDVKHELTSEKGMMFPDFVGIIEVERV